MIPPFSPTTVTSLTKVNRQPDCTWNVPMLLESLKLAYRYCAFAAKPMPLETPVSDAEPTADPAAMPLPGTMLITSDVKDSEAKMHWVLPLFTIARRFVPKNPPPAPRPGPGT